MSVIHEDKLVLSNPMQFAASFSTLVGFTPKESLVVVMFQQGQVSVTMRTDLPTSGQVDSVHIATTARILKQMVCYWLSAQIRRNCQMFTAN